MTDAPNPPDVRRVALLVNPAAGRHDMALLDRLAGRLRRRGLVVETVVSRAPGDLAARLASLTADVIAVSGGDGSVNEVVGALHRLAGPRPRLAVVPAGTANVLAHEYGLPTDVERLAAAIAAGRTRPLHLGLARRGDEPPCPFFLMASAGIDAEIVHAVEARATKRFKKLAFLTSAVKLGFRDRPTIAVTATTPEGGECRFVCAQAIVTKASHYGGPFVLTRATAMDRPGLRLVALADTGIAALLATGLRLVLGRVEGGRGVTALDVAAVRLEATDGRPLHIQIDGEPHGVGPVEISPCATVLDLIVE